MITISQIKEWSKPHSIGGDGRVTKIDTGFGMISIVGGGFGLYGDFENTFEVAILNNKSGSFITKLFSNYQFDDVIPYMTSDELVTLVNRLVNDKDFQVR